MSLLTFLMDRVEVHGELLRRKSFEYFSLRSFGHVISPFLLNKNFQKLNIHAS